MLEKLRFCRWHLPAWTTCPSCRWRRRRCRASTPSGAGWRDPASDWPGTPWVAARRSGPGRLRRALAPDAPRRPFTRVRDGRQSRWFVGDRCLLVDGDLADPRGFAVFSPGRWRRVPVMRLIRRLAHPRRPTRCAG
ncbi:MAG: hypothetical protein R3F60_29225 [bacterium]